MFRAATESLVQQPSSVGANLNEETLVKPAMHQSNARTPGIEIADVNSKNSDNSTRNTSLHAIAEKGDLDAARRVIVKRSYLITAPNKHHQQPIHLAAENGHDKILDFLLKNSADVDALAKYENDDGDIVSSVSVLHFAACYEHASCVELLLKHKAT